MLETKPVHVMGRGTNVDFTVDDTVSIDVAAQGLRDYLRENRRWCSRGVITVNVGRRLLAPQEITRLKAVLDAESGLTVARFWCDPRVLEEALSSDMGFGVALSPAGATGRPEDGDPGNPPDRRTRATTGAPADQAAGEVWREPESETGEAEPPSSPRVVPDRRLSNPAEWERLQHNQFVLEAGAPERGVENPEGPEGEGRSTEVVSGLNRGNEALLIKTTCRSGEVIRYAGDVVVFADVNPGAELIADGDIVVFGALRGLAHAGAGGDVQATITAMKLETHRLQIGPYTGLASRANQRSKSNRISPKIAYVRRAAIYVAPFAGRFAGYSGGTPYGG